MSFADVLKIEGTADTKNETFGDRILRVLEQQRRSKSWLASQLNISKQAMNYLLNHSSTPKYVNEIASALEVNPEWLLLGKGKQHLLDEQDAGILQIPILKFEDIHYFLSLDSEKNQNTEFTHLRSGLSATNKCFATILNNSSMYPLFSQGTLLIFNPMLEPKNGDFIIFLNDQNVFFRKYFIEGNEIYLKAFDVMYKIFQKKDIQILGVLIESRNQFK